MLACLFQKHDLFNTWFDCLVQTWFWLLNILFALLFFSRTTRHTFASLKWQLFTLLLANNDAGEYCEMHTIARFTFILCWCVHSFGKQHSNHPYKPKSDIKRTSVCPKMASMSHASHACQLTCYTNNKICLGPQVESCSSNHTNCEPHWWFQKHWIECW